MHRTALIIAALSAALSACESTPMGGSNAVYPARFAEAPQGQEREALRLFVRDVLGPDYMIDNLDALTRGPVMTAIDRGRTGGPGASLTLGPREFLLEIAGSDCRLRLVDPAPDAPSMIILAPRCVPIPRVTSAP